MEKYGNLTDKSLSDFADEDGQVKKAEYYDEEGFGIADLNNKYKLKKPMKIKNGDEGYKSKNIYNGDEDFV